MIREGETAAPPTATIPRGTYLPTSTTRLSIYPSIYLSINLSIHLSIYLSINLSIYLPTYLPQSALLLLSGLQLGLQLHQTHLLGEDLLLYPH